ncbi:hypothetical protein C8Q70DRAFT_1052163 [Cubamyces menziesii]|nr:hypothetical protein C8Q70DRAFT_1052163 [Cubamyces menziesii]
MPAISSTSRAILNLTGTPAMRPALDAPQVQQDALLSGTFGLAVYDPASSAYIAYGYSGIPFSRMLPSASYGPPPSSDNITLVNPNVDLLAFLKLGGFNMYWYEHSAAFMILIAILGHVTDAVFKYKEASPRHAAHRKRSKKKKAKKSKKAIETGKCLACFRTLDATISSLLSWRILQRAPESVSPPQEPQATHKKRNKKKKTKKIKKANATRPFCIIPTAMLGRITDTVSEYTKASRRLVTQTISSLLSSANADQTRVFGILRGSAASNSNHGDVDAEADEYLRSAFNAPDARSPPLMGWSDHEADETLSWHPSVEELGSWMFPSVPFEPFSHPLPSEDALAGLTAADADPVRPFGFVRTNYVKRVDYNEVYENAMLNVALDLPFSMEPFIYSWQIYCFPHEQLGRYPPVEEWTGMLEPRPMLAYYMRKGPGPPMYICGRWGPLG